MQQRFSIGDFTLELTASGEAADAVARAWQAFASTRPADAWIRATVDPARPRTATPTMPDQVLEPGGGLRLETPSFSASMDAQRRTMALSGADDRFGLDSCFKWLLAHHLAQRGGLLVHGVAVGHQGHAALFTGPSGAGKSTLGRFAASAGLMVLSDELVAVHPTSGGYVVEGTPWNVGRPSRAELRALGTLAWDQTPRVEDRPPADVVRVLLGNVLLPELGPTGRNAAFRNISSLANAVRTVQLWFAQDKSVGRALTPVLE